MAHEEEYLTVNGEVSQTHYRVVAQSEVEEYTFYVLDTEFLDESWRKDTGCERTTEDGTELGVETSDAHILELEVRCENRIWCSSVSILRLAHRIKTTMSTEHPLLCTGFNLYRRRRILHKRHIRSLHNNSRIPHSHPAPATPLPIRQLHGRTALNHRLQVLSMKLEHQHLSEGEDDAPERLDERPCHLIRRELFCHFEAAFEEADFESDVLEEGRRRERVD